MFWKRFFRSKSAHLVSDSTSTEDGSKSGRSKLESNNEEGPRDSDVDQSATSSFSAFLYSLLSSPRSCDHSNSDIRKDKITGWSNHKSNSMNGKKSILSRGGRDIHRAATFSSYGYEENKDDDEVKAADNASVSEQACHGERPIQLVKEPVISDDPPAISEPSVLLSENTRNVVYASLPALIHGKKWLLLYSTRRHGISLSTLYRRSNIWPGLSLLVVGDSKGAVFGGLVDAPLKPANKRRYQGTNNTFVFTDAPGHPVIFHPTGANRYFTLCGTDFLAIGGGGNFALLLDDDLLHGSSSVSETYGNRCLAHSEEFEVKDVELWGFVYYSKYGQALEINRK